MRIVFMGTPEFAQASLQKLIETGHNIVGVFTQPDKPKGRGYKLVAPPVKELALEHNIPVYQPEKMNYELLGNGDTHLHWHLFPRVTGDTPQKGPVWWLPREEMWNDAYRPTPHQLEEQTKRLKMQIQKVYQSRLGFGMKF